MDEAGPQASSGGRPQATSTSSARDAVPVEPRTRGFLFCDLRGYTAYVEAHGDGAGAALLERYRAIVRAAVARAAGAEIRTEGDGFYVVFPSASSAVHCGLDIVAAAAEANSQAPEGPIRVGVGIHAGESVEDAEGYVGSAVNIAARVCAVAEPGEVLVTDTVRGLVRTTLDVAFLPRGRPRLKGITEPIPLYRVTGAGRGAVATGHARDWSRMATGLLVGAVLLAAAAGLLVLRPWEPGGSSSPSPMPSSGARVLSPAPPTGPSSTSPSPASAGAPTSGPADLPGRLAFIATQNRLDLPDARAQLYVARARGGAWQRVTALTDRVSFATWSPDGRRLAYELANEPGPPHVVEVPAVAATSTGSAPTASDLPWPSAEGPIEWDGRRYLIGPLSWSTSGEVYVGGVAVDEGPTSVRIFAVAADGSSARLVTEPAPEVQPALDDDLQPAISGDGRTVVFLSGPNDRAMNVWLAPASAHGERAPVTTGMSVEALHAIAASWSPDGERLAFAGQATKGGPIEIWTIEARGTGLRRLTEDEVTDFGPAWSPDGRWIAWVRVVGGQQQIWVMAADGSGQRPLVVGTEGEQLDLVGWAQDPG